MNPWIRFLALVCERCPLCAMARRFPKSSFAQHMKRIEKFCPFCLAHEKSKQHDGNSKSLF